MKFRFPVTLFLALTVFVPVSHALEFRLLSWSGTIEDLKYANGKKSVEIVAWDCVLSPKYQFTGPGPLFLFREVKQDEKIVRVPVSTLPSPADFTHAILLLEATEATKTG